MCIEFVIAVLLDLSIIIHCYTHYTDCHGYP